MYGIGHANFLLVSIISNFLAILVIFSIDSRTCSSVWVAINEYLIREIMETKDNYADALEILIDEHVIAPCYYIIAGLKGNEGAII